MANCTIYVYVFTSTNFDCRGRPVAKICNQFPFFGSQRGQDAIEKIESLHHTDNKTHKETILWLYSVLNILDSKANGLLRVNSLFITLLVFFWGAARATGNPLKISPDQAATAVLGLILVMLSTIFCFMIVRVNWKFLGHVRKQRSAFNFADEGKRLANVVDDRTHFYWIAWLLTLTTVTLPILLWLHFPPMLWILRGLETHIPAPG
jgi:hypothetical protein